MNSNTSSLRGAIGIAIAVLVAYPLAGCSGASSALSTPPVASTMAQTRVPAAGLGSTGSTTPSGVRALGQISTLTTVSGVLKNVRPDHSKSWIVPDSHNKRKDFLYVSDAGTYDVYIYSYKNGEAGELIGTITGLDEPQGMCSSGKHVFVANTGSSEILEYKAGGTTPIATLSDSGYYPVGCSFDKISRKLAVSNILSTSDGDGNVAIYANAKGTPTFEGLPDIGKPFFIGYDGSGNLYVDGEVDLTDGGFAFAGQPEGYSSFLPMVLDQSIGFPGQVQWDGKYVVVGDQDAATLYQFTISGGNGTEEGSTPLTGSSDVVQAWIDGAHVIGPDAGLAQVGIYAYPVGGSPTQTITGFTVPVGATVGVK